LALTNVTTDLEAFETSITSFIEKTKAFIESSFGISEQKQQELAQQQQKSGGSGAPSMIKKFLSVLSGFLIDTILVLVYIFLFLYFRTHLKKFILKLVAETERAKATKIIYECSKVVQKYISGLAMMIGVLWIMYGIGFSIAGVKNPVFFAILCGVLETVPFIGNITGTAFTLIASLSQGGGLNLAIGILATYAIVQFIQTYLLEPLVVGSAANINPLFTIIGLVAGELVWGIPGMVLVLPDIGMVKIICDNIEPLKPYGFLIGKEKDESHQGIADKIKGLFKK
jgi:predicted PurR-regulated permease PerM